MRIKQEFYKLCDHMKDAPNKKPVRNIRCSEQR